MENPTHEELLDAVRTTNSPYWRSYITDRESYCLGYYDGLNGKDQTNPFAAQSSSSYINYNQGYCDGDNARIKTLPLSKFGQWFNGKLSQPGSFEKAIWEAFKLASDNNREILFKGFPDYFNERDLTFNY